MPIGIEPTTGWSDIDEQHADLLARADAVRAQVRGRNVAAALRSLDGLMEATVRHFAHEERLMEETRYPERARHRGAHELFLHDLHALASEMAEAGLTATVESWANERMPEWMAFHIQTNDLPLVRHLQRSRLRNPTPLTRPEPHS